MENGFENIRKKLFLPRLEGKTTGAGKTVCFQGLLVLYDLLYNGLVEQRKPESGTCLSLCWILNIYIVERKKLHLVVASPLIALMDEMVDSFRRTKAAELLGLTAARTSLDTDSDKDVNHIDIKNIQGFCSLFSVLKCYYFMVKTTHICIDNFLKFSLFSRSNKYRVYKPWNFDRYKAHVAVNSL